jgi:hypothetical protein
VAHSAIRTHTLVNSIAVKAHIQNVTPTGFLKASPCGFVVSSHGQSSVTLAALGIANSDP